ncbi:MAG: sulfite exporter TauE/SafE family protein, partial [Bacillota bacterium]
MSIIVSFFTAMGLGALHSLEPGHGKGLMGAYLAVSGGRLRDVLALGFSAAATHTVVVMLLALALHSAAGAVSTGSGVPAVQFERYLQLFSGLMITAIGLFMLRRSISRKHLGSCGCGCHSSPRRRTSSPSAGAFLVGVSNGLVPCPGSLAVALMSLSAGNLWSGFWLVLAFGIGGAATLVLVGLIFVRFYSAAGINSGGRLGRAVSLASSCLIVA